MFRVDDPPDWLQLRALVTNKWLGGRLQHSHIKMAVDLLHDVLVALYGQASITLLTQNAPSASFFCSLARTVTEHVKSRHWTRPTSCRIVNILRAIMQRCNVGPGVVRAMKMLPENTQAHKVFGKKYSQFPDAVRKRLELWLTRLQGCTTNQSAMSLRYVMRFFLRDVLQTFGVKLEDWDDKDNTTATRIVERCSGQAGSGGGGGGGGEGEGEAETVVRAICCRSKSPIIVRRKFYWLGLFLERILGLGISWTSPLDVNDVCISLAMSSVSSSAAANLDYYGNRQPEDMRDVHRIKTADLEKLHAVAVRVPFNELFFQTLLTTGMRVGGYVRMRCSEIADADSGKWIVRKQGQTVDKGNRIFHFNFTERVRELMGAWLNKERIFDSSDYVFPGVCGGYLSTENIRIRFKQMCDVAGLHGREFHVHSLRHCYSHILLELGNTPETISKLINHTSVRTTEMHYLRESSAEVSARAFIPWLRETEAKPQHTGTEKTDKTPARTRHTAAPTRNPVPLFLRNGDNNVFTKSTQHSVSVQHSANSAPQSQEQRRYAYMQDEKGAHAAHAMRVKLRKLLNE